MNSYGAELFKLAKRPAVWVVCVVWLVLLLAFTYIIPYYKYRATPGATDSLSTLQALLPSGLPAHVISGFPLWGGAFILVMGALVLGSEYAWGTLKTLFTIRPRRLSIFTAEVASLGTIVFLVVCAAFVFGALTSILIANLTHSPVQAPAMGPFLLAFGTGWLILFMWGLLGVSLAILSRGTALSIGFGLVWILVIELLIRSASSIHVFSVIEKYLPGTNVTAPADAIAGSGATTVVSGLHGLIFTLVYVTLFGSVGAFVLLRRDVD